MKTRTKQLLILLPAGFALFCLLGLAGLRLWCRHLALDTGRTARLSYQGDTTQALIQQALNETEPLAVRNRAIWALGLIADRRAQPALKSLLTGRDCDHERDVCQYELKKALSRITGALDRNGK